MDSLPELFPLHFYSLAQLIGVFIDELLQNLGPRSQIFKSPNPSPCTYSPLIGGSLSPRLFVKVEETLEGSPIVVHFYGINASTDAAGWEGRASYPTLLHHLHCVDGDRCSNPYPRLF